ncbi:PRD domain-containing protein [Paenibacillus sp. CN-4]|uniref:PRD domain-containing protein n=1 Tax=Paenibacillus nanchangensis TaxID=3348343 RepID=UPI00397E339C
MSRHTERFSVQRVIGNNVLLVESERSRKEYVLIGKGIGFSVKGAGVIDGADERIEKMFRLEDREEWSHYQVLLEDIDPRIMKITEEIIDEIAAVFPSELNNNVYLALPSHIQFTLYRLRNGMDIVNPFLQETMLTFPKEYEIACRAAGKIAETFQIRIPEDETGFLTYHVYSAVSHVTVGQIAKTSNLVSELVDMIRAENGLDFVQGDMSHVRLMIHLRYMLERMLKGTFAENPLVKQIKKEYKAEIGLAQKLAERIAASLDREVPEGEVCFLAMHLRRLHQTSRKPQQE